MNIVVESGERRVPRTASEDVCFEGTAAEAMSLAETAGSEPSASRGGRSPTRPTDATGPASAKATVDADAAGVPLLSWPVLFVPRTVAANLERVRRAALVARTPNTWQITLGVLRMWHRVLFRSETIGTCRANQVRDNWRARLLQYRVLRFPFLLAEKAVAPWDFSGLISSPERVVAHLLGAHHDEAQFVYDFEILECYPGALERVRDLARGVVEGEHEQAEWLRDLVVYERYHENLLEAVDRAIEGVDVVPDVQREDPDITFRAYLAWCAGQPETPAATLRAWRRGAFRFATGLLREVRGANDRQPQEAV